MKNISEYFTGDWRTDTWRIQKLIAYVHQADKRDLPVEANCGGYAWVGIYQKVLTSEQLAMIASLQSLHQTSGSVCTMIMPDGGISFPSGEIFLHSKTVKKLKKEAFLMLVAHELSHRVAWRMFTPEAEKVSQQQEYFADSLALWSAICLQVNIEEAVQFLDQIPGSKKGGTTHPSNQERVTYLTSLSKSWLASKKDKHETLTLSLNPHNHDLPSVLRFGANTSAELKNQNKPRHARIFSLDTRQAVGHGN